MFPERLRRVNSLIQVEISKIFEHYKERLNLLGNGFLLTITRVDVEKNLQKAVVYYSWTSSSRKEPQTVALQMEQVSQVLQEIAPSVMRELASRIRLKRFPRIRFEYDRNVEAGNRVYQILRGLEEQADVPSVEK